MIVYFVHILYCKIIKNTYYLLTVFVIISYGKITKQFTNGQLYPFEKENARTSLPESVLSENKYPETGVSCQNTYPGYFTVSLSASSRKA